MLGDRIDPGFHLPAAPTCTHSSASYSPNRTAIALIRGRSLSQTNPAEDFRIYGSGWLAWNDRLYRAVKILICYIRCKVALHDEIDGLHMRTLGEGIDELNC